MRAEGVDGGVDGVLVKQVLDIECVVVGMMMVSAGKKLRNLCHRTSMGAVSQFLAKCSFNGFGSSNTFEHMWQK